jgi:hypothetical protein
VIVAAVEFKMPSGGVDEFVSVIKKACGGDTLKLPTHSRSLGAAAAVAH